MTFDEMVQRIPGWLGGDGPETDLVLSSRARLARNIAGYPYVHRASKNKLAEVVDQVRAAAEMASLDMGGYFGNDELDDMRRRMLIERHLISPALAAKDGPYGVLADETEVDSIQINEEDHLRIQSFRSGFNPAGAMEDVDGIDTLLSRTVKFSFSEKYGYLTACPTNMGTGLRVSVLIHLPALVLTKEIQRLARSSSQLGLAIRGYYGEGSDIVGNLFQISNQRSLGKSTGDIIEGLITVVNQILQYERQAAKTLMNEARRQTEDKIWRSIGILRTARIMSTQEFMTLSSAVRLGCFLELVDRKFITVINDLMILSQPGHLQVRLGSGEDTVERDHFRAGMIRERFGDVAL